MDKKEKRSSKRIDINVKIKLSAIERTKDKSLRLDEFDVDVVNLSKNGLAFRSEEKLELNTFYDTKIILWTKETIDTIIEIVRMENLGNEPTLYGCRFIGMVSADTIKFHIYEMFNE